MNTLLTECLAMVIYKESTTDMKERRIRADMCRICVYLCLRYTSMVERWGIRMIATRY